MTLSEFVAYLTNGRLPADELFERQFDSAYSFTKQDIEAAELKARCALELGLVRTTGYRYTRLPLLSLPFVSIITLTGFAFASLFKGSIKHRIETQPLSPALLALSLMGTPLAFKMLRPHYAIKKYRHLKRKYCADRKLYLDFLSDEEAEKSKWIEKNSYLPIQTPPVVMDKILKQAVKDCGEIDGRIGISPDTDRKLGSYRFDLPHNRVFISYKSSLLKDNWLTKFLAPLYRRFTGWKDLQISTKDALERFHSLNKPEFECAYEWEETDYSENDLNFGEYNQDDATLYYTLCRDIYSALDLENSFADYTSAELRKEIVKRAPSIPEKRIEALLGVLPHRSKGGRPKGKKDENYRHKN